MFYNRYLKLKENKAHSRAKIRLDTTNEVTKFVQQMNSMGLLDKYVVEDFNGTHRVSAHSYLGMLYASAEFTDGMFLVNLTTEGELPSFVDAYRDYGDDNTNIYR